jgi:hypothetical protein
MKSDRAHPLYHLDVETLLVAIYAWVVAFRRKHRNDELKTLKEQGIRLLVFPSRSSPKPQKYKKAALAELLTPAIFLIQQVFALRSRQGQDLSKGYLAAKAFPKPFFPSPPHLSRFYRVFQKANVLCGLISPIVWPGE